MGRAWPTEARAAIALLVAGWALCGCDFTKVPGLNASLTFEAVSSLIKQDPDALHAIRAAWAGGRDEVLAIERTLRRLVMLCAACLGERKGARQATKSALANVESVPLRRGCYTISYWCFNEPKGGVADFGFGGLCGGW